MSDFEAILEAERRGILPADMAGVLNEARRRGLVPAAANSGSGLSQEQQRKRDNLQAELDQNLARADEAGQSLKREETGAAIARPIFRGAVDLADGVLALPRLIASAPVAATNFLAGTNYPLPISGSVTDIADDLRGLAGDKKSSARQLLAPRNDVEQLASTVTRGLGGVLFGTGVGGLLAGGAGGAGAVSTGNTLAANPGLQVAGAVTGGTASEIARKKGAGPIVQAVAGALGGAAPSLAQAITSGATRALIRGGEAGRQQIDANLSSFERAGTTPSVGQATQSRVSRAAETLLSRVPGSAGRMAKKAAAQSEEIAKGIDSTAGRIAGKTSATQAGLKIQAGITGPGGFVDRTKSMQETLYNALDQYIPPATHSPVSNTQTALRDLTKVDPGAARTTAGLVSPKIKQIADDLAADAQTGSVPYSTIKALRTRVGEMLEDGLVSDVPQKQLRRLYGALSEDLRQAADQAGPAAQRAWARANKYTRARSRRMEVLDEVVNKSGGPEAIFKAATAGTSEGATKLRSVLQSLDEQGQKAISATVLRRLGKSINSQQDDIGEKFSTETFLTNWNKLSTEAKSALFDRFGSDYRRDIDSLSKVAANLREGSKVFVNPSGTAQGGSQIAAASAGAAALAALGMGNPLPAVGLASALGGANLAARGMTNPNFVRWLAVSTKLPKSTYTSQITQLEELGKTHKDPLLTEIAGFLKQQGGKQDDSANDQRRDNPGR